MADRFDLIVIGGGPGGYVAAIRASQLGKKVACIDKRGVFGGTCLNVGCIPSKALLDSSELYAQAKHSFAKHGIKATGVALDIPVMLERKNKVVSQLTTGIAGLFKKYGVTSFAGTGAITGKDKVKVTLNDGKTVDLEAPAILLATGSEPTPIPALPFDGKNIVSSTEALNFDPVPKHLIVVGAGYIGLELGSVWARLGSKVTVLEFLPRILPLTDTEIANQVKKSLEKQGLEFQLETKVTGADVKGGQVTVKAEGKDGAKTFTGDKVLVCVGRRPVTAGLGLEALGIKVEKGKVIVNPETFQTSVPGVFAIGDLIDGPMLAHKASEEGIAFAEMLAGQHAHVNYDAIPSVIYIWPEVASVGKTEDQLKAEGREYRTGKFPFMASGRAIAMADTEGMVKVLTDAKTDRLLGVHIFGPRASDMIAEAVTTMEFVGSAEDIARIVHAHPTLSESLGEAARAAYFGKAIHA